MIVNPFTLGFYSPSNQLLLRMAADGDRRRLERREDEGGVMAVVGFEIRKGRPATYCEWGDCIVPEERRCGGQGRGFGFVEVVILDRRSFPACRRHRREVEPILCSLLPDMELEAVA